MSLSPATGQAQRLDGGQGGGRRPEPEPLNAGLRVAVGRVRWEVAGGVHGDRLACGLCPNDWHYALTPPDPCWAPTGGGAVGTNRAQHARQRFERARMDHLAAPESSPKLPLGRMAELHNVAPSHLHLGLRWSGPGEPGAWAGVARRQARNDTHASF